MKKIITSHIYPPIPDRRFDWTAYRDGNEEGGPYGYGPTEAEAIADLVENEEPTVFEEPGVTTITLPNGDEYYVTEITAGAFVGDYQISGPNRFYLDGFPSQETAVKHLLNNVEWRD